MLYYFDIKSKDKVNKSDFIKNITDLIKELEANINNPSDMLDGESHVATGLEEKLKSANKILTDVSNITDDKIQTIDNKYTRSFSTLLNELHGQAKKDYEAKLAEREKLNKEGSEHFSDIALTPAAPLKPSITIKAPPGPSDYCSYIISEASGQESVKLSEILDKPNKLKALLPTKEELNSLKKDKPEEEKKLIKSQEQSIKDLDNLPKFTEGKRVPDPNNSSKLLIYWISPGETDFNDKGIIYTVDVKNPNEILEIRYGSNANAIITTPPKDGRGACIALIKNNEHKVYGDTSLVKFGDKDISRVSNRIEEIVNSDKENKNPKDGYKDRIRKQPISKSGYAAACNQNYGSNTQVL